jgi:DNA repair protein RecO (recombination protein O)
MKSHYLASPAQKASSAKLAAAKKAIAPQKGRATLPAPLLKLFLTMLHSTKAIVLRTVPYSETSLIVAAFTETFGLQSYLVKGARRVNKKGGSQVSMLQPCAILDLVVYQNDLRHLQIIKEMKWAFVYQQVMGQVVKNSVALYMVELLSKCLKQPESNASLYAFAESQFLLLDEADAAITANLPLYFALHLASELGFQIDNNYSPERPILDLQAGSFTTEIPAHGMAIGAPLAEITHQLLEQNNAVTLYRLKLTQGMRQQLLAAYERFYQYHLPDFGFLRSRRVLEEVLG